MCGTVMRGADALPGSKATSRAKGSHRNLGDLASGRRCHVLCAEYGGPHREGEEPEPMMHGPEKSDPVIVAMKPANRAKELAAEASAGANAAESVERRAGAKGNAHQQSTHWTQRQARVTQALERIRQAFAVIHPRWEPYAGKPHVRIWAGACDETHVPTATAKAARAKAQTRLHPACHRPAPGQLRGRAVHSGHASKQSARLPPDATQAR